MKTIARNIPRIARNITRDITRFTRIYYNMSSIGKTVGDIS